MALAPGRACPTACSSRPGRLPARRAAGRGGRDRLRVAGQGRRARPWRAATRARPRACSAPALGAWRGSALDRRGGRGVRVRARRPARRAARRRDPRPDRGRPRARRGGRRPDRRAPRADRRRPAGRAAGRAADARPRRHRPPGRGAGRLPAHPRPARRPPRRRPVAAARAGLPGDTPPGDPAGRSPAPPDPARPGPPAGPAAASRWQPGDQRTAPPGPAASAGARRRAAAPGRAPPADQLRRPRRRRGRRAQAAGRRAPGHAHRPGRRRQDAARDRGGGAASRSRPGARSSPRSPTRPRCRTRSSTRSACASARSPGAAPTRRATRPTGCAPPSPTGRRCSILDNCEHVIDAAAALAARLLADCPRVRILATSREPLQIPGETLHVVAPLAGAARARRSRRSPAPTRPCGCSPDRAAAVLRRLRARRRPTRTAVARICRTLDGMPLAIELAAPWLRTLTPAQLAERLDDRFALLTGGSRTALPTAPDAARGRRLELEPAVGARSGRWPAASPSSPAARPSPRRSGSRPAGPGGAARPAPVLPTLAGLVGKSILSRGGRRGRARPAYRMLETVRAYGLERLAEAGEDTAVRDAAAALLPGPRGDRRPAAAHQRRRPAGSAC